MWKQEVFSASDGYFGVPICPTIRQLQTSEENVNELREPVRVIVDLHLHDAKKLSGSQNSGIRKADAGFDGVKPSMCGATEEM